jgi:hypothetical protein
MKLSKMLCASLVALAALALSADGAFAQNNNTCWEFVTWNAVTWTGSAPNSHGCAPIGSTMTGTTCATAGGGQPVSGTTIEVAASQCHEDTRKAFQASTLWATAALACPRFPGQTLEALAIDRFKEIAETPQLYNRVDGFKVKCDLTGVPVPHTEAPYTGLVGDVPPY